MAPATTKKHWVNRSLIITIVPILWALYLKIDEAKVRNITNDLYIKELVVFKKEAEIKLYKQDKLIDSLIISLKARNRVHLKTKN